LGQNISDEAKRYFDRGVAAVEMAKSPADYQSAIKEFEQAINLAPGWPDVYYNLGLVQEKAEKYGDAVISFRQYLKYAPTANDVETVKSLINKLEYKRDKTDKKMEIINAMIRGTIHRKGGSSGGICHIERFVLLGDELRANIWCMVPTFRQSIPAEFDGSVLKFKYKYYGCLNMPNYKDYPCTWEVSIVAEAIAASPLRFKVKESWARKFAEAFSESYDAEWEFNQ
jgi:tetratricopeptide (TPR) repeat protein